MQRKNMKFILSLVLICVSLSAQSASVLPAHYPTQFQAQGKVTEKVDYRTRVIKFDTIRYALTLDSKIHSPNGSIATFYELKKGTKIGVNFSSSYGAKKKISEIWILPKDYPVTSHAL